MNVADSLVEILKENGLNTIFGIPGEQILPFYEALQKSSIKNVLVRHEQSAAHAAETFSKLSNSFGVCLATAGPGALNLVMGVATAFKDNVPILVITGDNPLDIKNSDEFQSFALSNIFKNITIKSFNPENPKEAILDLKQAIDILNNYPAGPIHINLSKDLLLKEAVVTEYKSKITYDYFSLKRAQQFINSSKRPFFILGSGAISTRENIEKIAKKHKIPLATTFPAKGIISEDESINLGLVGNRGSNQSDYAIENSDCVIALGTRLTDRTVKMDIENKLVHVNIDKQALKGKLQICGNVEEVLNKLKFNDYGDWLEEILKVENNVYDEGINDESLPLRPQSAINSIYKFLGDNITISDAGSHTTWTTIMKVAKTPNNLIYSGGFAPMGYGVPAAIGAAFARSEEKIVVINGDGGFQMNVQELATIKYYNLNILIFVLNNSEYGIIRQSEERLYDMEPYQTELDNPDFVELVKAYGIKAVRLKTKKDLENTIKDLSGPCVIEVPVRRENIPLP